MRRLSEALLLALLLVAVQTAVLTHEHADGPSPAGAAAQVCEYCTGSPSPAAPPQPGPVAALEPPTMPAGRLARDPLPPSRYFAAHRSRAPPPFRST